MRRRGNFWRNVTIIAVAHLLILLGLLRWSDAARKPLSTDIAWIETGALETPPVTDASATAAPEDLPPIAAEPTPEEAIPQPAIEAAPPTPIPKPKPTATPRKAKPVSTPKAAPKKNAQHSPKILPSPKKLAGAGGVRGGAIPTENPSQFAAYGNMLHDRFFSSWEQPTSVVATGAKMSVLVRVRIERDGRVGSFSLVRPSGNVVVDESVAAVAKRVLKVDPLPAGLANGGHYEVNINFELNAD